MKKIIKLHKKKILLSASLVFILCAVVHISYGATGDNCASGLAKKNCECCDELACPEDMNGVEGKWLCQKNCSSSLIACKAFCTGHASSDDCLDCPHTKCDVCVYHYACNCVECPHTGCDDCLNPSCDYCGCDGCPLGNCNGCRNGTCDLPLCECTYCGCSSCLTIITAPGKCSTCNTPFTCPTSTHECKCECDCQ